MLEPKPKQITEDMKDTKHTAEAAPAQVAQHTPGPWIFEGHPNSITVWSDERGRSAEIAKVTQRGELNGEGMSNARLIAAAPELLQALQACLEAMARLASNAGDVPEWNEGGFAHEACNQARAAIEKAQGGQP